LSSSQTIDKMAVVFHGIIGGVAGRNGIGAAVDMQKCAKLFKHNVLKHNDSDVFMHSWSVEHEDVLKSLYNPVRCNFQPQEMFGYLGSKETNSHVEIGQAFRTLSRYTSLERAMLLKTNYEIENGIRYRWVLVVRFDLIFFTKLDLHNLDHSCFYVCSEPHWKDINEWGMVHDVVFLANSDLMDEYSRIAKEIKSGKHNDVSHATHIITYRKLKEMFSGDMGRVRYGFKRYQDVEIYRFIVNPQQNPIGHAYGALDTKGRMEKLLEEIDKNGHPDE
jgi:hypothetical protein